MLFIAWVITETSNWIDYSFDIDLILLGKPIFELLHVVGFVYLLYSLAIIAPNVL